jgi:hypothetical protein
MHEYRTLETPAELEKHIVPILKANGSEIPPIDCYVAAVEFDEQGQVVAYQLLQNAIFLEGLWARDSSAHLLAVYRTAAKFAEEKLGATRVLTMTREDETGNRIGRIAEKLGFERMRWNIFRRKQCR